MVYDVSIRGPFFLAQADGKNIFLEITSDCWFLRVFDLAELFLQIACYSTELFHPIV